MLSRNCHLTLEFVPIFLQFGDRVLDERLGFGVVIAYIFGCVDENIDALLQNLLTRSGDAATEMKIEER